MTRGLFGAALLLQVAAGAAAQVDSTARRDTTRSDSTARRDTTTRDTAAHYLPVFPEPILAGPLPRGTRYTFTADSFALSNVQTLSDLLAHIPGVYVARGGIYGAAEPVLYGGRGAAGLEIYWDGVPYLAQGRDSVFIDPARISLAPLERVDVVVLPAALRVYLVTWRQRSTETTSLVGVATGEVRTANYRGAFLRRWRSGLGLSLVADYNNNDGIAGTSSTAFNSVDLWLKAEYLPSPRLGASYQIVSSRWHRDAETGTAGGPLTANWESQRRDAIFRVVAAARSDGLGARATATLTTTHTSRDSAVADRGVRQASLELRNDWPRAHLAIAFRTQGDARPWQVEGTGAWSPLPGLTIAGDARRSAYDRGRRGRRAHLTAGLLLPAGFSIHGDLAWARDLQAPADSADQEQRTVDAAAALRWDRGWLNLEVGGVSRDPFAPIGRPAGLASLDSLGPTQHTRYITAHAVLHVLPGLELAGWYFDPYVRGGNDWEPPYHARTSLTFYSKFWRVYRSGIFALRGELALESWSTGTAGYSGGTLATLPGRSFGEVNIELRIAGVTIYWIQRNLTLTRGSYVPGLDYPRRFQFYGVRWVFTN
ncbi:MAG TPA: Plug domain-containing protein [Gemmatimonadales bacterium]|nr:Plug domain-containing protein [Gemmatimonadales bacterium]